MKPLEGMRILVVDDDNDLNEILSFALKMNSAIVECADGGWSAWELLQTNTYDVILCDMRMPKGDGLFLSQKIKESGKSDSVFILHSGFNDVTELQREELGIDCVLKKPSSIVELEQIILKLREKFIKKPA